ncbi:MAG: mandelate racemase/muconate lactonizing enzyme family protein, partial [Gaiellaceae bacterium]
IIGDFLFPAIQGLDPRQPGVVHEAMGTAVKGHPYAKAALDIAIYDAAGRALGVPVSTLLGGAIRDGIEVAHSLGIMEDDQALAEAEQAVSEGARTIKVKTGIDPARDVRLVHRLRERVGEAVKIRVDANEGYATVEEAIRVTRAQEEAGIFLCEQPVVGTPGLAAVAAAVGVPVMADESAWTAHDMVELAAARAAACFSCYVTKPGGLYRARQQAEIAATLGFYCDIGGSIELGIGNAANLHLGAALPIASLPSVCPVTTPKGTADGTVAGVYYVDDIVAERSPFEDGRVLVPDRPGLGVEVDTEKLDHYAT